MESAPELSVAIRGRGRGQAAAKFSCRPFQDHPKGQMFVRDVSTFIATKPRCTADFLVIERMQ